MALFTHLYDAALRWARHRHAPRYLAGLSFAESSFFPIPPDVMLAPMCLARPRRAWWFAALCTISSVAGGLAGYLIGRLACCTLSDDAKRAVFGQSMAALLKERTLS